MHASIPLPPRDYRLCAGEVHLWQIAIDGAAPAVDRFAERLTAAERVRADRYRLPVDRLRYTVGRGTVRLLLGALLETEPERLAIRADAYGKPHVDEADAVERLAFNVSHSGNHVLVALARGRSVGVDVEEIRDIDVEGLAREVFSPRERAALAALPAVERPLAFYRGWCRKEAVVKAIGSGLSHSLHAIEVLLEPPGAQEVVVRAPAGEGGAHWHVRDIFIDGSHMAALAVEGAGFTVRTFAPFAPAGREAQQPGP